jgi:hypothetical protein
MSSIQLSNQCIPMYFINLLILFYKTESNLDDNINVIQTNVFSEQGIWMEHRIHH